MPQHGAHHPTKADHNAAFLQIVPSKKQLKISTFDSSNAHNGLPPNHDFSRSQTCIVDYGPSNINFWTNFPTNFLWKWKTSNFVLLKSLSKLSRILCFVDYFTILYHDGVHYFNFVFTVLYFVIRH